MHTLICECRIHHKFVLRMPEELQVSLYSRPLVLQGIAAGIGTSNFLRAFSKSFLGFLTRWVHEVNTSQFSCIVKLRFFDSPLLLLFSYWRFWHVFPHLWPQGGWPGCRLLPCQSPPGPCTSIPRFFVQVPWTKWSLSTYLTSLGPHQRSNKSSMLFSSVTSSDVLVALVTSIYFSGIENDASLGTYSLTLGSTWWR